MLLSAAFTVGFSPSLRSVGSPVATAAAPASVVMPMVAAAAGPFVSARASFLVMAEAAAAQSFEQVMKDADAVFTCIDADGDGTVTLDELVAHLTASGYTEEAVGKIFEKLDVDGSGGITKEELREGMKTYTPLRKAPGFGNYNAEFKEEIHQDADALFNSIDTVSHPPPSDHRPSKLDPAVRLAACPAAHGGGRIDYACHPLSRTRPLLALTGSVALSLRLPLRTATAR